MQKINHEHIMMKWLAALALTRLVLPFLLQNSWYQPHRDEYLYLDYAKHMDWGYMEVPPLLSVFSWLTFHLGNSHFLVKFWPALFGAGTFFLCGHLIIKLGGNLYALLLFFCAFILGAYIRLFFLFQPGFLEVFCWTGIVYTLIRHQLSGQRKWIYLLGIACGMGMLSKYTTAFLITCLMVSLLISRQRHILFTKPFVIAAIIAFCLFLPNLYWQYQHNFPVAFHMEELRQTQLRYVSPVDFLAGQLIMNFVYAFTWITGLIALWFKKSWKPYRWLGFTFLFTIALLMAGSAKDYYALGLYPPIIAVGCLQVERFLQNKNMVVKSSVIALPLAAGIFILPLGLPMFKPAKLAKYYEKAGFTKALGFKWEDQQNHPLPQDFSDMVGWKELAEMAADQYHKLPDSVKTSTTIFCRGYYSAGALNFYGKKLGLPEALSDNGSYLQWLPDSFTFKHLMLIGHRNPDADDIVFNHFESRSVLDSLYVPYFRENGIKVFFFENGSDSMRYYANEGIRLERMKFTR